MLKLIGWIKTHLEKRRQARQRCKENANQLSSADPVKAYYNAQRLAAQNRCAGNTDEFRHWSRVAAEIARSEPRAEMDFNRVIAINDREEARQKHNDMSRERNRG